MKKYITIAFLCIGLSLIAACGAKEEAEDTQVEMSNSEQVYWNIKKDLTGDAQDIIDASQKAVYSSFEEVCNDYSDMLGELYMAQESDLKREIAEGKDNNALAKSLADKVAKLEDIAAEGVATMSRMAAINPTENSDYSEWRDRLNSVCLAYETELNAVFAEAAK